MQLPWLHDVTLHQHDHFDITCFNATFIRLATLCNITEAGHVLGTTGDVDRKNK